MVAVNTDLEQPDEFAEARTEYNSLHPWALVSIVSLVVSLFGWVIVLVYLTMAAGHGEEDDLIHLNIFDKIKTELFFTDVCNADGGIDRNDAFRFGGKLGIPGMLVMAGVGAFMYDALFILFYLSMVRRVKAGVLWEYSFLRWFGKNMRRVLGTWKCSVRSITAVRV